jgi:Carboxypeptidase regulatory-like domain
VIALLVALAAAPSGVSGLTLTSPTCPVERYPPDPVCAPRRLPDALVVARRSDDRRRVASTRSDENGRFSLRLRAGRYTLRASRGHSLPRPATELVTVHTGKVARVRLVLDSGIR